MLQVVPERFIIEIIDDANLLVSTEKVWIRKTLRNWLQERRR